MIIEDIWHLVILNTIQIIIYTPLVIRLKKFRSNTPIVDDFILKFLFYFFLVILFQQLFQNISHIILLSIRTDVPFRVQIGYSSLYPLIGIANFLFSLKIWMDSVLISLAIRIIFLKIKKKTVYYIKLEKIFITLVIAIYILILFIDPVNVTFETNQIILYFDQFRIISIGDSIIAFIYGLLLFLFTVDMFRKSVSKLISINTLILAMSLIVVSYWFKAIFGLFFYSYSIKFDFLLIICLMQIFGALILNFIIYLSNKSSISQTKMELISTIEKKVFILIYIVLTLKIVAIIVSFFIINIVANVESILLIGLIFAIIILSSALVLGTIFRNQTYQMFCFLIADITLSLLLCIVLQNGAIYYVFPMMLLQYAVKLHERVIQFAYFCFISLFHLIIISDLIIPTFKIQYIDLQSPGLIVFHIVFTVISFFIVRWITRRIHFSIMDQASVDQIQSNLMNSERYYLIGKLAGGVAHEINNPIMSIMNFANLILDDLTENSIKGIVPDTIKDARESLQEIVRQCARISKITKNLLDFSRPRQIKYEILEIEPLILEALNFLEPFLVKAQIQILFDLPEKNHRCKLNPSDIKEVFVNLLNNSIYALIEKYSGIKKQPNEKYIKITVREEKIIKESDVINYVVIRFYDDGIGMTDEVQQNLFTPFITTKKIKSGQYTDTPSLGLGLIRSLSILEDHKGTIKYESIVNIFTQFDVYLPLITSNKDQLFF